MPDPYNLHRFLEAQAPVFDTVLAELRQGRKRSHWMWFSLVAAKGNKSATDLRHRVAEQMTPEQIAEAKRLAAEWKSKAP